jgi:hypothetical protein
MTLTRSRRDLEQLVRETFRAKADQLAVDTTPVRRDNPMLAVVVGDPRGRQVRGLRLAMAIAVAVVLVAVVAAVTLTRPSDTSSPRPTPNSVRPAAGVVQHPSTGSILAPADAPNGTQLWSLQTSTNNGDRETFATTQLFGHLTADGAPDPGILIETTAVGGGLQIFPNETNVATIHGQRAPIHASKDAGAAPTEIDWIENDVMVRATIRGLDADQAATILDHMQPRTTGLLSGVDPATAPTDLPLLGEHAKASSTSATTDAYLEYGAQAPTAGAPVGILVHTSTAYGYPGYLRGWIAGTGSPNGSEHFDPDIGLFLTRPDGTTIVVGPASVDRDELERIAKSVVHIDEARVHNLQDDLDDRLASLPILGTTEAVGMTLELHGTTTPTTLCVHSPDTSPVCAPPLTLFSSVATTMPDWIIGSLIVDGHWYVVATSPVQPTLYTTTTGPQPYSEASDQIKGQIGPWLFTATTVPDGDTTISASNDVTPAAGGSFLPIPDPR